MNESVNISRRTLLKGTAAMAGAALAGGAFEIVHPEGAIAEEAPVEVKYTYCDMCNHVPKCGIAASVKDGKVVRVEARDKYPADPICAKGISSLQELYDPHRITYPMVRTNPKGTGAPEWEPISWDDAYARIASELNRIKEESGPEAVLFYCGDPKEPRGAMQRLATLFGSPTYGTESSTCAAATWICSQLVTGQLTMGSDPTDATASCLVWSLNPAWSQPYRFGDMMKQKERGCKFVIVDPRITPTVMGLADIHLQLRPGSTARSPSGSSTSSSATGSWTSSSSRNGRTATKASPTWQPSIRPRKSRRSPGCPRPSWKRPCTCWPKTRPARWSLARQGSPIPRTWGTRCAPCS